jgi:hypothetical protein
VDRVGFLRGILVVLVVLGLGVNVGHCLRIKSSPADLLLKLTLILYFLVPLGLEVNFDDWVWREGLLLSGLCVAAPFNLAN